MGKLVILQMTSHMLKLTPVKKAGRHYHYDIPVPFALPETLVGGDMSQNIFNFAEFSNSCLKKMKLNHAQIIICVDDGSVIAKEFLHLPVKPAVLLSTARLEAESVLPDGADDYYVEVCSYRDKAAEDGKLKSMLYAAPKKLIDNIIKQFKRYGLKVRRIAPSISGLVEAGRTVLSSLDEEKDNCGKTIALVDLGFEKIGLAMFEKGEPIFERSFDSVYDDIIDIICDARGMTLDTAARGLRQSGISSAAGGRVERQAQIDLLIETACGEVIRNIRVVLSSKRMELDSIIFCGAFTTLPGFSDFLLKLGLDIPFLNLEQLSAKAGHDILLQSKTAGNGFSTINFFALSGLITKNQKHMVNFLREPHKRKSDRKATFAVMSILTGLMLLAMAVQPFLYWVSFQRGISDTNILTSARFTEIKLILKERDALEKTLAGISNDQAALPFGKSKTNETYRKVFTDIVSNDVLIQNLSYDNNTGLIGLVFKTPSFESYLSTRNLIMSDGYFIVAVPFSASYDKNAQEYKYECRVTLKVSDFEKFPQEIPTAPADETAINSNSEGGSQ